EEVRQSFLKYIASKTTVFLKNYDLAAARLDDLFSKAEKNFTELSQEIAHQKPSELFCNSAFIKKELKDFALVELGTQTFFQNEKELITVNFHTKPQPSFHIKFNFF